MVSFPKLSKLPPSDDLGLGTRPGPGRSVNKDGTFNVRRVGLPAFRGYELYHSLITMGGFRFLGLLFLGFLITNVLFAAVYLGLGMEHFVRTGGSGRLDRMLDAFFFSAQTLTTVGYGHISPNSHLVSAVAALESLLGLLSFALATGLLYGRFSRPHAQMCFSQHGIVAPYRDITAFMFRFVNRRSNQLIEVEATVSLSYLDGESGTRRFVTLTLERTKINLFPTSWTVVHPIDEASPLFGMSHEDLRQAQAEFIVLIKAFDDTFAQTIYQRTSYTAEEVLWGVRFLPMTTPGLDGVLEMDVDLVDATEAAGPLA
jgi:inward rectifier potassium channel